MSLFWQTSGFTDQTQIRVLRTWTSLGEDDSRDTLKIGGKESRQVAWKELESFIVKSAKTGKFFSTIDFFISSNLVGTTSLILHWNKSEV
ncbi:hypothetical protein WICPIJ_001705 [Wickerhamomyces pijperi]|uniref:Uncharacterized protein n=1 Tax=Wickerhamomyces pijperi TaxID=599730 RepID=A0A9P8QB43_WICPI|nr:hypothetical protein WICPIJ_001705 [Wickerhamomyces pijperi]